MRKEICWDNCVVKTQYQLSILRGGGGGGAGGGGGLNTGSQTTILCVSWVTKQMVYLISATCLDDLCAAISSPGKPAVGGSKHTEVWSYI